MAYIHRIERKTSSLHGRSFFFKKVFYPEKRRLLLPIFQKKRYISISKQVKMNTETNKLHILIKSLTKSEKRYFKLYSNQSTPDKEKNYIKLFDVLERMPDYSEEGLLANLQTEGVNAKYLAADKNHLYNLILRSLRNFHTSRTSRLKVKECLEYAEILLDKGLKDQALQQMQKGQKIAHQYDIVSYLPELLRLERRISGLPIKVKDIEKKYHDYKEALAKLENFNEYDFLHSRTNFVRRKVGKTRNSAELQLFQEVLEHPLMQPNQTLSFFSEVRFHQIWASYYYSKNDWQKEYEHNKLLLDLMANKKEFLEEYSLEYASTFSRVLILTKQAAPNAYFSTLNSFREIPAKTVRHQRQVKSLVECLAYSTESVRMIKQGLFDEAIVIIPEFEHFLLDYNDLIEPAFKMNSYYKFAYVCIGMDDYSRALDYLNKVLNEFDEKLRPDIYRYSKILTLIVHLELGNTTLLPYISKSTIHYLKSRKKLFKTEKLLVDFIKKIKPDANNVHAWKEHLPALRANFIQVFEEPNERNALQYFDFITWLDSKIEGRSFLEVKRGK